nr:sugar phosphate nucleotidyltransferase [Desulfofundulus thermocisternus]
MAGGAGERFWPLSRRGRPKQFLSLSSTPPAGWWPPWGWRTW